MRLQILRAKVVCACGKFEFENSQGCVLHGSDQRGRMVLFYFLMNDLTFRT